MQLAGTLRGYRKKSGLSQNEAGAKVGLQQKTVSSLERLPEKSKIGNLFKLLSALNLEIIIREKYDIPTNANKGEW